MAGNSLETRWGLLEPGTPNIEFWYPADIPSDIIRIYHGIQHNVPNRQVAKTTLRTKSAGNEYNFRNVGYNSEFMRVDVVLATKTEARNFTDFFKYTIKGSSGVFYYKNNFNGQESYVRLMGSQLNMGEAEGAPYSYSLLLKKEAPYAIGRLNMKWNVLFSVVVVPLMLFRSSALYTSFILKPTNSMKLYASGRNIPGRFGDGTTNDSLVFSRIGAEVDWTFIAPGGNHTLALKENGGLYVTGYNNKGQLGFGDTTTRLSWTRVGSDLWISAAGCINSSIAVKSDGTLWSCGENANGQLGYGTSDSDPHTTFQQVGTDSDWTDVRANINYVIARKSNGTLWAWGNNDSGQCGQNYRGGDLLDITQIGILTNWTTHFVCGEGNAFALRENGWLYGWGSNSSGALGIGDGVNSFVLTPQQVSGIWKYIGSGQAGAVAIKSDGTMWAWGNNVAGQLGQGTSDSSWHPSPIQIGTDTDWASVAYARNAIIAAKEDERVYGWGAGLYGCLGLGNTDTILVPTLTFVPPKNDVNLKWDLIPPPGNEVTLNWDLIPPPGNETYLRWNILFDFPPPPM